MFFLKKIKGEKGFTLMEMLMVVAIIILLVAISVPVLTNQLSEARNATDAANLRVARTLAIESYLGGDTSVVGKYYDVDKGTFTSTKPQAYAQGNKTDGKVIKASISGTGEVTVSWVEE